MATQHLTDRRRRNSWHRDASVLLTVIGIAWLASSCTSGAVDDSVMGSPESPEPVIEVSTVTSMEPRSPDDLLSELDAWLLCRGASNDQLGDTWTILPYSGDSSVDETVTDNGDGTWDVSVQFAPESDGYGGEILCSAGGTVGDPSVTVEGVRDFG